MKNRIFHLLQKGALLCLLVLAVSGCAFLSGLKDWIMDKPEGKSAITPEAAPPPEPRETPSGKASGVAAPPAARDKTPAQAISSQPEADFLSHTVKWKGETLSVIAKWYTESLDNWKKIAEANPGLDPARIAIGSKLLIPDRLLKTRKPMPKKYINEFNIRQNIETESPETAPQPDKKTEPDKGPELFGPKDFSK
jgi:hypothetical protein